MTEKNYDLKKLNIIFGLMLGYSLVYMDKNMVSTAIIPIAQNLNLKEVHTGMIMSSFFLGYSLMQIPAGLLADKLGPKKTLIISLLFISTFIFLFGISGSFLFLAISRFFTGVGHGGYPPGCAKAISDSFSPKERTFVQSLILSTTGIGGILAFTVGAQLISRNWHYAYYFLCSSYVISLLLIWKTLPAKSKNNNNSGGKTLKDFAKLFKNKNVILLFISMFLINVLLYGVLSWNPSFIKSKFNLSIQSIGLLLSLNSIFTFLSIMLTGKLLSTLFLGKEKLFLLFSGIISAILIFLFISAPNIPTTIITLILSSMFSYGCFTCIFTWPHKIMPEELIGSSIAIINTGGTLGGFFAPMIFGWLITMSNGSFRSSYIAMSIVVIFTGIVSLFVTNKKDINIENGGDK